jgi:hypothetical protein
MVNLVFLIISRNANIIVVYNLKYKREKGVGDMFKAAIRVLFIGLFAVVIGYIFAMSTQSSSFAAKSIRYKVIDVSHVNNTRQLEEAFNKVGAEGWELVEWGRQPTAVFKK